MTAPILVVDDVAANRRLLEAQLSAEYFDVISAADGAEALALCARDECDLVLLDVMMPDIDGFEVCRRLKSNPATHHIPVVMVTALDQATDRVAGLDAGADDFLTKPGSDLVLIARVRSLVRLKMMTDELRMRAVTSKEIGLQNPAREAVADTGRGARILIVDDRQTSWERMAQTLALEHTVDVETDPRKAVFQAAETPFDLAIVSLGLENYDGLRLCSHIRSLDRTRNLPLLAIAEADDNTRLMRGLEIGVNDYLIRPIDPNELLARVRTQVKKKRYAERLRDNVQMSIEAAITDALTGLHNPPLHGKPSRHAGGAGGGARSAAQHPHSRYRFLQVDQRHPWPFRRRRSAQGILPAAEEGGPRNRPRLPLRRRRVRGGDAGHRHRHGDGGGGAAAPAHRRRAVPDQPEHPDGAGDDFDRHCGDAIGRGPAEHDHQARRPGALPRQERRPQPGGRRRRVSGGGGDRIFEEQPHAK
jgi:DNA-binding response OmpR family regulator